MPKETQIIVNVPYASAYLCTGTDSELLDNIDARIDKDNVELWTTVCDDADSRAHVCVTLTPDEADALAGELHAEAENARER